MIWCRRLLPLAFLIVLSCGLGDEKFIPKITYKGRIVSDSTNIIPYVKIEVANKSTGYVFDSSKTVSPDFQGNYSLLIDGYVEIDRNQSTKHWLAGPLIIRVFHPLVKETIDTFSVDELKDFKNIGGYEYKVPDIPISMKSTP